MLGSLSLVNSTRSLLPTPRLAGPLRVHGPALAVLALVVALCLYEAVLGVRTQALTAADFLEFYPLAATQPGGGGRNVVLADPAMQMEAWAVLARSELHQGRWPLWNPYNGGGRPLMGNLQSALFSPFTWPLLLGPPQVGLLVSAWAKLFVLAAGTYWFLLELGLSRRSAVFGALAHATGGLYFLWLSYPHVGSLAFVAVALAAVERWIRRFRTGERPGRMTGAILVASLTWIVLGGHPEAAGFGLLLIALWSAVRLAHVALAGARTKGACARCAASLVGLALLAAALCSVQLLPFFEYLPRTAVIHSARESHSVFAFENWPLAFFPNLAGRPVDGMYFHDSIPAPNYQEVVAFHAGALPLFLVLFSPLVLWRALASYQRGAALTLLVLALLAALLFFQGTGWSHVWAARPWLHVLPLNRGQVLWLLPASALAAFVLEHLSTQRSPRPQVLAGCVLASGVGVLLFFRWGAEAFHGLWLEPLAEGRAHVREFANAHVWRVSAWFLTGIAALALCCFRGPRPLRLATTALASAALLGSSAIELRGYVPTSPKHQRFARTSEMDRFQGAVGTEQFVGLGTVVLPADSNSAYRLRQLSAYDGMWLEPYDSHFAIAFQGKNLGRDATSATAQALERFGTPWIASNSDWPAFETEFSYLRPFRLIRPQHALVHSSQSVVQRFVPSRDGLCAIRIRFAAQTAGRDAALDFEIQDDTSGSVLARATTHSRALTPDGSGLLQYVFRFENLREIAGRPLSLRISSPAGALGQAPIVRLSMGMDHLRRRDAARFLARKKLFPVATWDGNVAWKLYQEVPGKGPLTRLEGGLDFDLSYGLDRLQAHGMFANMHLYRYSGQASRAWLVGEATLLPDADWKKRTAAAGGYSAAHEVLIAAGEGVPANKEILRGERSLATRLDLPMRTKWQVSSESGAWLVTAQALYPGWKASIDGTVARLWPANGAFAAVRVPPGEHIVDLVYAPGSVRLGAWISALAALLGVWLFLRAREAH